MKKLLIALVLISGSAIAQDYDCSAVLLPVRPSDKCHAQSLTEPENFADYSWTGKQLLAEAAATSLLYIDYKQTIAIQTYQGNYDTNPILGPHPNNRKIKNYFSAVEALQLGGEMAFPLLRLPISGGIIVVEGITTARNRVLGFTFKW